MTANVCKFELARAFFGKRTEENVRISEKFKLSELELSSIKLLRQTQGLKSVFKITKVRIKQHSN